jgi:general secretion pathway protein C
MKSLFKLHFWLIALTFISCTVGESRQSPVATQQTQLGPPTCGSGLVAPHSNEGAAHQEVALGTTIKERSDNEYDVSHAEFRCALSNLHDVAFQARIVPSFKQGKAQGFKLFAIRPDSIYTKMGLHNGDVLTRVNGYELSTPETALGMLTALQDTSRIDVEFERNGSKLRKTYHVN